jgi:hypothetical protein
VAALVVVKAQQVGTSTPTLHEQTFARVERIGEANARSFFVFSTSAGDITIRQDGHAEVNTPGVKRRNFDLKLGMTGRLERVYFVEHGGDLILVYEVTDTRSGWGYLVRMDQKTMKQRWLAPLKSYNIGPGLLEMETGYFSGANTLCKIDLATGAYLWELPDLDKQYSPGIEEFQEPLLKGDNVLFREHGSRERELSVEKLSGRIIGDKR